MSRIPLLRPEDMTPEQRRVYDIFTGTRKPGGRRARGAPYQLTLHWPEFTEKWHATGVTLRHHGILPPGLAELAILVTVRHWDCHYAWHTHSAAALTKGLPAALIDAIKAGRRPAFEAAAEEAVYDYCRELHEKHCVSDAAYQRVLDRLGVAGVVELTALIGYYTMVAMTLNAHAYPAPGDVSPPQPVSG